MGSETTSAIAWKEVTLGEFTTLQRGHDLPKQDRRDGTVPILGSFGITGWHDTSKTKGPGVTVGRSGASFGVVSYSECDFWPLNTALFVKDFHGNDERFAYYFLKAMDFRRYNSGSAVQSLNRNHVHPIAIRIPPLPEQKAIAHILGTLDDKIELNRRMNVTLESMARALFKSWFVDFDPVIDNALAAGNPIPEPMSARAQSRRNLGTDRKSLPENTLFPDSFVHSEEMGWIPKGWKISTVADVTHRVTKGDTPRKAAMAAASEDEPRVNMLRVNAITEHGEFLREKFLDIPESIHLGKSKRSILKPNYILYTNAGTIGRVAFVHDDILPANTNQAIAIIQPDETKIPPAFLFMVVRQPEFQSELHFDIVEAVQANLALGKIGEARFLMPSNSVLNGFMEQLSDSLDRIWANRRGSLTLSRLRDTLLPKLLSGELRIPDAEKLVTGSLYRWTNF